MIRQAGLSCLLIQDATEGHTRGHFLGVCFMAVLAQTATAPASMDSSMPLLAQHFPRVHSTVAHHRCRRRDNGGRVAKTIQDSAGVVVLCMAGGRV